MSQDFIPYANLGLQSAKIKSDILAAVEKVIDSGTYILGPEVKAFEEEFASYCGTSHALGVSNGTCSLHLVLRSLDIGDGDEVITAPNSFVASAAAVALVGAKPIFADIGGDLNIDPEKVEEAITKKTKAIIPVHLTGRPARMDRILEIAKKHNLFVIEDAAQAVGATFNGKRVGSFGEVGSFSLHPLKNLYAFGDAGIVTIKDNGFLETLRKARNHGLRNRSDCDFFSFNCRLDEIQAACLRIQLRNLDSYTDERRRLAFKYNEALKNHVEVPLEGKGEYCVYQTYVIRAGKRDALFDFMVKNSVDVKIHYPVPIHMQKAAEYLGNEPSDFPETLKASKEILSLPLYPGLTDSEQNKVIDLIQRFYAG